jgi:DNA-directed RNA polymerase subunit omega
MNNQVSKDGMRYPSVDQLSSKSSSKYKLVIAVATRAHEIDATKKVYLENTHNSKSIGIALEEILEDKIKIK